MKLEQIFYVIEIAETGSFSQAARNLYISQPNLSYSIKQLEEELGFQIFNRKNSPVLTTARGQELITRFRIIAQECDNVKKIKELEEYPTQINLNVATLNTARISSIILPIAEKYLHAPIKFALTNYTDFTPLLQHLSTCQIDMAFLGTVSSYLHSLRILLKNNNIEYNPIKQVPLCAIVGKHSPLYSASTINMEDLFPYTIISYEGLDEDSSYSLSVASGLKTRARGLIQINNSQLFFQLVQSSDAVGLIAADPSVSFWQEHHDFQLIPIQDCPIKVELSWIKPSRIPLSGIAAELLEYYKKFC